MICIPTWLAILLVAPLVLFAMLCALLLGIILLLIGSILVEGD
jgi:hypothetical protein